jgi:inositol oxygenase
MTKWVTNHSATKDYLMALGQQYLYHVVKDQCTLPEEALAMIRYHSFYPYVA